MRTALWLLLAFATPTFASQTVWKWVDGDGVTHYSDRPVPGATRIELNVGRPADAREATSPPPAPAPTTPSAPARSAVSAEYTDFEIAQPKNEETIPNTGGVVAIEVRLRPALRPGHSLSLFLDGKRVEGQSGDATSFELRDVPRGAHTVVATIIDVDGRRIRETAPVTFFVRQTSIATQPPVGPALRRPPRPRPGATNTLPARQPGYGDLNGARAPVDPRTNRPPPPQPAPKTSN